MKYRIENTSSGMELGTYEAPSPEEALERMYRDAGYASADDAPKEGRAHLTVTEVE